jgi:DNA uptake protein ComE-like DNA-binding protein
MLLDAKISDVSVALIELGVKAYEIQVETILRELQRCAKANKIAKAEGVFENNYRTWVQVNKQFYPTQIESNKAWKLQKQVLEHMQQGKQKVVLDQEVDLNTASVEHLQCLPLSTVQIKAIIEYRVQKPFYRVSDLLQVPGIGPVAHKKVAPFLKRLAYDLRDPLDGKAGDVGYTTTHMPTLPQAPTPVSESQRVLNLFNLLKPGQGAAGSYDPPHECLMARPVENLQLTGNPYLIGDRWEVLQTTSSTMQIGDLWADSGCIRGVGGHGGHKRNRAYLQEYGLKPIQAQCHEQFQFGDGKIEPSVIKHYYPVFVKGEYRGTLDQAEVNCDCPQLLSKQMMKKWDVDLCFGKSQTKIHKFNVEFPFSAHDVPIVNIFDFDSKQLNEQWHKIPDHFKINQKPPPRALDYKHRTVIKRNGKDVTLETSVGKPPQVVQTVHFAETE